MINKAILMGRLTRDPELRHTGSGTPVCSFTIAIDNGYGESGGYFGGGRCAAFVVFGYIGSIRSGIFGSYVDTAFVVGRFIAAASAKRNEHTQREE